MSTSKVIKAVASRTSVSRRPEESYEDYFDRLDKVHGVDESDREQLEALVEKELFSPDSALSGTEKHEIGEICNRLLDTEAAGKDESQGAWTSVTDGLITSSGSGQHDPFEYVEIDDATSASSMLGTKPSPRSSRLSAQGKEKTHQSLKRAFTRFDVAYLLPLVVCGTFVFFYGLGTFPLAPWDEGFYANLARHMVQDGYWLVPHMHYAIGLESSGFEPWMRLPLLGIWLQAISMLIFGVNEFAVRFPSAAAGVLTVITVYFIGRDLKSRQAGFVAGLVYITTPYVYGGFNAGRDGALDSLLVLFGSLFIYTTWLAASRDEPRWLYPMGLFAGLAVLTKGFGAGVFLIVALPLVFFAQRVFISKSMGYAIGVTSLLTLPWPIYMYSRYGDVFINNFFVEYILERAVTEGLRTNTLFAFMEYPYITKLLFSPELFHPWTFILLAGIPIYAYRQFITEERESTLKSGFLIWWIVATFGLFVFIGDKGWYILPMYVPAAVLIGGVVNEAIQGQSTEALVVVLGAGLLLIVSPAYSLTSTPEKFVAPGVVFALGSVLVVWAAPSQDYLVKRLPTPVFSVLSNLAPLFVALVLVSSFVGVPPTSANPTQKALAEELNRQSPESERVFIESEMDRPFHTFSFYAQRPLEGGPITELQSSGVRYAVLTENSLQEVDVDMRIIMNGTIGKSQQVSLVEVDQ